MSSWLIVILCAVGAVVLFVLGMSLTLMIKGRNIDSEISTNKNMQRLGIRCAVHETRAADGRAQCSDAGGRGKNDGRGKSGESDATPNGAADCAGNCSSCDVDS